MVMATQNRPTPSATEQNRERNGRFGQNRVGETSLAADSLVQCGLCVTCRSARDDYDTGDMCANDTGGACVLSPQNCSCTDCKK